MAPSEVKPQQGNCSGWCDIILDVASDRHACEDLQCTSVRVHALANSVQLALALELYAPLARLPTIPHSGVFCVLAGRNGIPDAALYGDPCAAQRVGCDPRCARLPSKFIRPANRRGSRRVATAREFSRSAGRLARCLMRLTRDGPLPIWPILLPASSTRCAAAPPAGRSTLVRRRRRRSHRELTAARRQPWRHWRTEQGLQLLWQ
eukprot:scaffold266795_cov32-Tisochrysis_lutea.AAC.1